MYRVGALPEESVWGEAAVNNNYADCTTGS